MPHRCLSISLLGVIVAMGIGIAPGSIALAAEAGPGEGMVIFNRKSSMKGKAIQFNIQQDGRPIGQLRSGTTIKVPLAPGSYNFTVRAPSLDGEDFLTINVEAGWTYNVEGKILWGWPTGRPKFYLGTQTPGPAFSSAQPAARKAAPNPAPTPALAPAAMAGPALGSTAPQPVATAQAGVTADDKGRISLRNFNGDWDFDMWSLATDFSKLEGRGAATGRAMGDGATQIYITEFASVAFPEASGGGRLFIYQASEQGFMLESEFKFSGELLKFSGQYDEVTGRFIFYLSDGTGGETATGMSRSSVRVEIRSLDFDTWVAETYSSVSGQAIKVQSYRFTRR
ncbi:MAG: hypothetical protein DRR15_02030 [Gammaproteobacteria bacterium]|nr:MAG: hypothetical protein DRR15_02030 [Gammaproteobacteria bacterium]